MNIKSLKEAIGGLPDDSEIDVVFNEALLLLDRIEPSDWNNTIAFHVVEPEKSDEE